MDCSTLQKIVQSFSIVKGCDVLADGTLRVCTPFCYPDGSSIDLFVESNANLMNSEASGLFHGTMVSDGAQTALWLLNFHLPFWGTKKRRALVEKISESLDVKFDNGKLVVTFENEDLTEFPSAMVRIAQACIRIADIHYLQRFPTSTYFKDDVEEFIERTNQQYEPDIALPGKFGREVPIDFRVKGSRITSLLKTVTSKRTPSAHWAMNEVFVGWSDLAEYHVNNQFVTVLEDSKLALFKQADKDRLASISTVISFPSEQEQFRELLAA